MWVPKILQFVGSNALGESECPILTL